MLPTHTHTQFNFQTYFIFSLYSLISCIDVSVFIPSVWTSPNMAINLWTCPQLSSILKRKKIAAQRLKNTQWLLVLSRFAVSLRLISLRLLLIMIRWLVPFENNAASCSKEGPSSTEKAIVFPDRVSLDFNAILLQLKNIVKVKVELSRLF